MPIYEYEPNTGGPAEADRIIAGDGRRHNPKHEVYFNRNRGVARPLSPRRRGGSNNMEVEKFGEAAKTYANNPTAFHLRALNMLYEGLKQNATIVIVPSTAVETMQLGGLAGVTALTMGLGQERANKEKESETVSKPAAR
jgi:hypothetical protein